LKYPHPETIGTKVKYMGNMPEHRYGQEWAGRNFPF